MKNPNPTYTIELKAVGDHLEAYVPELDITVETSPGETSYDVALNLANDAPSCSVNPHVLTSPLVRCAINISPADNGRSSSSTLERPAITS